MPHLVKTLKHTNPRVRCNAAEALGFIGPEAKDAVPVLQEARRDEEQSVRLPSSVALAWITRDKVPSADKAASEEGVSRSRLFSRAMEEYLKNRRGQQIMDALNRVYTDDDQAEELQITKLAKAKIRPLLDKW